MNKEIESSDGFVFDLEEFVQEEMNDFEDYPAKEGIATRLGLALLELGDLNKSKQFFSRASEEWLTSFEIVLDAQLEDEELSNISDFPVRDLLNAVYTGILSGDEEYMLEIAERANEELEQPYVQEYNSLTHRFELIKAISSIILEDSGYRFFDDVYEVKNRYSENTDREFVELYYPSQLNSLKGIYKRDKNRLADGIEELLECQRKIIDGSEDEHIVDQCLSLEASALVALAYNKGMEIRVNSKYIPEKVYEIY